MSAVKKLLKHLPQQFLPGAGAALNEDVDVEDFVKNILSNPDINEDAIEKELNRNLSLSKSRADDGVKKEEKRRQNANKDPGLSNGQRRKARLHVLPKKGLKFKDFEPVHSMWCDYMKQLLNNDLNHKGLTNDSGSKQLENISTSICKADLVGAYITVTRAKDVGSVGTEGFVAVETKNVFQILGKDNRIRTIPKRTCKFMFELDGFRFKFLGKYFCLRSVERSARKLKIPVFDDL